MNLINNILKNSSFMFISVCFGLIIVQIVAEDKCNLPQECQLKRDSLFEFGDIESGLKLIKCYSVNCVLDSTSRLNFNSTSQQLLNECELKDESIFYFSFLSRPFAKIRFDLNVEFASVLKYLNIFSSLSNEPKFKLRFSLINGFQINNNPNNSQFNNNFELSFVNSKMDFYLNDGDNNAQIIDSCKDLEELEMARNWSYFSIFEINSIYELCFWRCQFDTKICPLIFKNANVRSLLISNLIKSYLKTNVLFFTDFKGYINFILIS